MKVVQRNILLAAGGLAAYYAIRNSVSPDEIPIAEGNDLVMDNQAGNSALGMDAAQFERLIDDVVTINGIVVILLPGSRFNPTDSYYPSPNATREQLNLIVSQVNNSLRNKSQFNVTQEVTLKDISRVAHIALVNLSIQERNSGGVPGDHRPTLPNPLAAISLDGIF